MLDVIIIGAGVSGCAIARELSRWKADILVVEQEEDVCCGTSKANSAIVHAGFDAKNGSLMARLNVQGSAMMPALSRELDFPYRQIGSLVVMLRPEDRPRLNALYENGVKNGVSGLRVVEREELVSMEPNISDDAVAALYAPTGGIVCPFGLTYALAENAAANGVRFQFDTRVEALEKTSSGWRLATSRGQLEARVVVNAAGVWADTLHNQACPNPITIQPRRGDYFLLDHTAGSHVRHTVFQLPGPQGKGVLVSPTVHGNLIVGPTAIDVPDKDSTATTQMGLDEVRFKSSAAVKNLPLRQTITSFAGLRAHELGHDFLIQESAPGFVDCAGIASPGLSASPAIGKMAAGIVASILKPEPNPDFRPTRKGILDPRQLSIAERNALIQRNPAYGTVICRCESITEGEIVDAIHRVPGARSIDVVKRRTRAGMGRCQGGFCSPRVLEILARELGLSPEAITKCGGGSRLILGRNKDTL